MIMAEETAMLKAKEEFQKIEQAIRQASIEGERTDVIQGGLWERMLHLGRCCLHKGRLGDMQLSLLTMRTRPAEN